MNPAFSVIFLTTLIGAAQGLFVALAGLELAGLASRPFLALGGGLSLALSSLGLLASFFHLGRPERAWRAAAMWRTSWLSREVIALPAFMGCAAVWALAQWLDAPLARQASPWLAGAGVLLALVLFVCTAMIYASLRFLQEWASAYTLVNYTLLGLASGATLAAALAGLCGAEPAASGSNNLVAAPGVVSMLCWWACGLTVLGGLSRTLSLARNARLKPKSSLQTALGIRHPKIRQTTQGFMGGSFNTREFFHGKGAPLLRQIKGFFLLAAFVVPALLLAVGGAGDASALPLLAFGVQYLGLLAERWFFFAQANHPQNLYYQSVA
jgi:DMSO reductase anchor subunit